MSISEKEQRSSQSLDEFDTPEDRKLVRKVDFRYVSVPVNVINRL